MPIKGSWTDREDALLRQLVKEYGPKQWSVIAAKLKTKGSKQCRRRWKNCLNADLKSGGWSADEDRILMEGHRIHGNKWTEIAKMVGGRTDNAVKNRYAALSKRDTRPGARRSGASGRKRHRSDSSDTSDSDGDAEDYSDDPGDTAIRPSATLSQRPNPRPSRGSKESLGAAPKVLKRGGAGAGGSTSPPRAGPRALVAPPPAPAPVGAVEAGAVRTASPGLMQRPLGDASSSQQHQQEQHRHQHQQPEPDLPRKRRALLHGVGASLAGSGSALQLAGSTPRTPWLPAQLQVASASHPDQQPTPALAQTQAQAQHPTQQRPRSSDARKGEDGRDAGCVSGGSFSFGGAAYKRLPVTISIPDGARADPTAQGSPTPTAAAHGIEIRVLKDLLTPCEIQFARELNDPHPPPPPQRSLHIDSDDGDDDDNAGTGADRANWSRLASGSGAPPPPAARRRYRAAGGPALPDLISPGSTADDAMAEFHDVLQWFQDDPTSLRGSTAHSGTAQHLSRHATDMPPPGVAGGGSYSDQYGNPLAGAGMLGTGLTPKGLLPWEGPEGGVGGGSRGAGEELSARIRRQVAVAAALGSGFTGHGSGMAQAGHE